jgi:AcrR family transcriptional regulator
MPYSTTTLDPRRGGPGRPPRIDRAAIGRAGLAVGFDRLTVTAVADALGVGTATLYHHVRSRDELALLAADAAAAAVAWPESVGPWRPYLSACAHQLWHLLEEHPGLAQVAASLTLPPPTILARFEAACVHLIDDGFPPDAAVLAVDAVLDLAIDSFVRGSAARQSMVASGADQSLQAGTWPGMADDRVIAVMRDVVLRDPHDWFHQKLELVLDGIEARAGRSVGTADTRRDGLGTTR